MSYWLLAMSGVLLWYYLIYAWIHRHDACHICTVKQAKIDELQKRLDRWESGDHS